MPIIPMNVGFQGQSGRNADIAEPSLLTQMASAACYLLIFCPAHFLG
jgi:hypothetical protein